MDQRTVPPLQLVVAGGGEGTYKNLAAAVLSKDPHLNMRIHTVIDVKPFAELHSEMRRIITEGGITYLSPANPLHPALPENGAGIVMTPNASHLWWADTFVHNRLCAWVEKPACTSLDDLAAFLRLARLFPSRVYASEYATDGKAIGLLWVGGALHADDPRSLHLEAPEGCLPLLHGIISDLGKPLRITGTLLEGTGAAGTADHRPWLLNGRHGGMIRDLAPHLFGPLYDVGLITESVLEPDVILGRYEPGTSLGTFRPIRTAAEGETYAKITGVFETPGSGFVPFSFEVGKYWPAHDRALFVEFPTGTVSFSYEKPFTVRVARLNEHFEMRLRTDFYPSIALLDFVHFIEKQPYASGHIERAAAIVRFNEAMRLAGLRRLGLA